MSIEHTERTIQHRLSQKFNSREIVMPNVYVYGSNESDFLTVTKSGYVDEYEIKLSRTDFHADKNKERHEIYATVTPWRHWPSKNANAEFTRVELVANIASRYPNRFWYVVPAGLVEIAEIPIYAGLITVDYQLREVKRAPRLHRNKIPALKLSKIIRTGYQRFIYEWASAGYQQQRAAANGSATA